MSDSVIKVEGLGKRYKIGRLQRHDTLRDRIGHSRLFNLFKGRNGDGLSAKGRGQRATDDALPLALSSLPQDTIWALRDVSFEVKRGEVIGVIGRNGAGKSTLLKILSRITEPTEGYADINGRVGSLLEVGTGFHPELTGRENIYLNGSILGMRRAEINKRFDEIVAFSEIEKFIDTPVKHYSSGMYVRLAFGVAAHLNPEILLVDEVLAVGDVAFQKKCLGKMNDVAREGRTVLFVSHNMGTVRKLCPKTILLEGGGVRCNDVTETVIGQYLATNASHSGHWAQSKTLPDSSGVYLLEVNITNGHGTPVGTIPSNRLFNIDVSVIAQNDVSAAQIHTRITNQEGIVIFTTANTDVAGSDLVIKEGVHTYRIKIPENFLPPGLYEVTVGTMIPKRKLFDMVENELFFAIEDVGNHATILRDGRLGVVTPIFDWEETNGARTISI